MVHNIKFSIYIKWVVAKTGAGAAKMDGGWQLKQVGPAKAAKTGGGKLKWMGAS